VDASVFVNAFNPREDGHAESLAILAAIHHGGHPVIVPTLLVSDIASAVARASDDTAGALQYASATAALSHLTLVASTSVTAREAAELAATFGCVVGASAPDRRDVAGTFIEVCLVTIYYARSWRPWRR
jgi:predicted nucleic acid-binding protein